MTPATALLWSALMAAQAAPAAAEEPAAVRVAGREIELQFGGLLQAQAELGDAGDARWGDDEDRIFLRRARLNVTGRFAEEVGFRVELDASGTLASTSNMRAQLTDAYATWTRHKAAQVRFGQFKTPYGYEQLAPDPRLLTPERSLVNDRLTMGRQLGVQVGGDLLDARVSWAAGAFNGTGTNTTANDNDQFLGVARAAWVPWRAEGRRLSVGLDGFGSRDDAVGAAPELGFTQSVFKGRRRGAGLDVQWVLPRLEVWAEALGVRWEPEDLVPRDRVDSLGAYAYAAIPLDRASRVQALLSYQTFDPDRDAAGGGTDTWGAGLNLYLKGHDLKAQAHVLRFSPDGQDARTRVLLRAQVAF
jgi:phosphate-selective porin OprO/OprP